MIRKTAIAAALVLLCAGLIYADHTYQAVADVHDIMEYVQKPSMDQLAAIMKAGGPQSDDDWQHSKAFASILSETTQLIVMGGRTKDEVWTSGATLVIDGAKLTMAASEGKDPGGWKNGVGMMGKGCRTCHKVHKPPTEQ